MNLPRDRLIVGHDGLSRCWWCSNDVQYMRYHDEEWGRPVYDDICLFEKICLEGFQSGLSWLTILRKRENFRAAFDGFNFIKVAQYTDSDIDRLLGDAGIVRHRGKIVASINNAARAIEMVKEYGSLSDYFWRWKPLDQGDPMRAHCPESIALSKDLKKRGWTFVGPTTCYAFMQAMGMVNDHLPGCHVRDKMSS